MKQKTGIFRQRQRYFRGFTLIEVLAVTAILIIIATVAASNFRPIIESRNLDHLTKSLSSTIALAQSLSQKNGEYTLLCGGTDDTNCETSWQNGWSLFQIDHENSGLKKAYSFANPYPDILTITTNTEITFNSKSQLYGSTEEVIIFCSASGETASEVRISVSGVRTSIIDIGSGDEQC